MAISSLTSCPRCGSEHYSGPHTRPARESQTMRERYMTCRKCKVTNVIGYTTHRLMKLERALSLCENDRRCEVLRARIAQEKMEAGLLLT